MFLDGSLVEGVDLRCLGLAAGRDDLVRNAVERGESAPGEEDPRSLAREGPGGCTADGPTASVDHSVLVLKQHHSPHR
jgi:hypothetical protein